MAYRNRSTGWKHAKLSGHRNEDLVKELLDNDKEYAASFLSRMGVEQDYIAQASIGGLHETDVPSVVGNRKTKSKTDLKLVLESGKAVNVSVKKSLTGQVYFVRAGMLIEVFAQQFGRQIPLPVQRAIQLFWAAAEDAPAIIEQYADHSNEKNLALQMRHRSLNAETLRAYREDLYDALLDWLVENAYEIAALCFSMGAVRDRAEWSDYLWYKNMLGEHDTDTLFPIKDICRAVRDRAAEETYYSPKNGGTTIQLPFGFVQWHQGQLQFHHNYEKLRAMLCSEG